jgi:hypothetical protein
LIIGGAAIVLGVVGGDVGGFALHRTYKNKERIEDLENG